MNIVVLGAGGVGGYVARVLSREGHNVIVVDEDSKALDKLAKEADVATRCGTKTDCHLLEQLLEESPDFLLAFSESDEENFVACTIAKNLGYPKTVAKVRKNHCLNRSRLDFQRLFFIDHLIPAQQIVAHDLCKSIMHPGNLAIENFAGSSVQMRTLQIPTKWHRANKTIEELDLPSHLLVGLIRRQKISGEQEIIFPKGTTVLKEGDEVVFIGQTSVMLQLGDLFNLIEKPPSLVVLAGGSAVAIQTASLLLERGICVKILEQDEEKCRSLARELPQVTVLNQDAADLNALRSENVHCADVFAACTSSDAFNILATSLAKQMGCKEVIALISESSYIPLLKGQGIHYTLSEGESLAARLRAIVHADALLNIFSLYENEAQIVELKVSSDSEIVGIPLADLSSHFPKEFLIALIESRGGIAIPKGNNILSPGDAVIVISNPKHVPELEKLFSCSSETLAGL